MREDDWKFVISTILWMMCKLLNYDCKRDFGDKDFVLVEYMGLEHIELGLEHNLIVERKFFKFQMKPTLSK